MRGFLGSQGGHHLEVIRLIVVVNGLLVFATTLLVYVTWLYVRHTREIAESSEKAAEGANASALAAKESVGVMRRQADISLRALHHLQEPVLILRHAGEGSEEIVVQNVGEGAAIWPKVHWADDLAKGTILKDERGNPPHILPPQQFGEWGNDDLNRTWALQGPAERQLFSVRPEDIPEEQGFRTLRVRCQDPRTAEYVDQPWRVTFTRARARWDVEPDGPKERSPISGEPQGR